MTDITAAPYNAVGDMVIVVDDFTIAADGTHLHSTADQWSPSIVTTPFQCIFINEANDQFSQLEAHIIGYVSPTEIVLDVAAGNGLPDLAHGVGTSQRVMWGTDNAAAFRNYITAHAGMTDTLLVPPGDYLISGVNPGAIVVFGSGMRELTISGYGASIGGQVGWGGGAIQFLPNTSALVQDVNAGDTSVTCITAGDSSNFSVGQFCILGSLCIQTSGFPPNLQFVDFVSVQSISGGVVHFNETVGSAHKAHYPLYNPGRNEVGSFSYGGPATLYAMDPTFDVDLTVNGLTLYPPTNVGPNPHGRIVSFVDCSGPDVGPGPTMTQYYTMTGCNFPAFGVEVDKLIGTANFNSCTLFSIFCQSASPQVMNVTGCTLVSLSGGQRTFTSGNTITGTTGGNGMSFGGGGYGSNRFWVSNSDTVNTLFIKYTNVHDVEAQYTLDVAGTITGPMTSAFNDNFRWAVPGAWMQMAGQLASENHVFQITDVVGDGRGVWSHLTITNGTKNLHSDVAIWAPGDIGKPIDVSGAGTAGGDLLTVIDGYSGPQDIVLHDPAITGIPGTFEFLIFGYVHIYTKGGLSGPSWPNVPRGVGRLDINMLPLDSLTVTNGTGCPAIIDYSQAGAQGKPPRSYSKRSYARVASGTVLRLVNDITTGGIDGDTNGKLVQLSVNVSPAFTTGGLHLSVIPATLTPPGYTSSGDWRPEIDLTAAGNRIITPTSSGTAFGADSGLAAPGSVWVEQTFLVLTGTVAGGDPGVATIEWQCDQQVRSSSHSTRNLRGNF